MPQKKETFLLKLDHKKMGKQDYHMTLDEILKEEELITSEDAEARIEQKLAEVQARYYAYLLSGSRREPPKEGSVPIENPQKEFSSEVRNFLFRRLYELSGEVIHFKNQCENQNVIIKRLAKEIAGLRIKEHRRAQKSTLKRQRKLLGAKKNQINSPGFHGSFLETLAMKKSNKVPSSSIILEDETPNKPQHFEGFEAVEGLSEKHIELLKQAGVHSTQELGNKDVDFLTEILGDDRPYGWKTWIMQAKMIEYGLSEELTAFQKEYFASPKSEV